MGQTATAACELVSRAGARVPLVGVSARAEIRDYACRVVLSQRFRNDEVQPIEAVYKFPLDESAAVCGFEAEIDGRVVKGRVEEREKAFETYDDAMRAGHGAYLLDEERADVFTVSVGNLPPGKEAVLRLTTVSELVLEGDAIRFALPTTIAPRYAPAADRRGVGETEAARVTPPFALDVPYGLTLELDVQAGTRVRAVESPSHPVSVAIDEGRATVRLSEREAALDRDVVVLVTLAEAHEPRVVVERAPDGQAYALVSFRPRLEAKAAPADVVFLVDRSGSMQGRSIEEARNALQLALRSLGSGCRFNIVGFGSRFESLFPESRSYDEASLAEAVAHVKRMRADLGGTELLPALEHALQAPAAEGLARQVFVLTDGQVSNTDEVIALGRRHAGHARIFTFGIGTAASHHLVKGLARAGEGEFEFIAPGERIEGKVMRQLSRALVPALADVHVDWAGLAAAQAPHEVPPVFDGGRVLVFARLGAPDPATVTLRAKTPEGPLSFSLTVDPGTAAEGTLVGTLWARRAIRDLEEGRSDLHPRRGSQQERALGLKDEKVKAEIVRLGTAWSLASRHTSFVAVEERETPTEGEAALRKVPVRIARGWHGLEVGMPGAAAAAPLKLSRPSAMAFDADSQDERDMAFGKAETGEPRLRATRAGRRGVLHGLFFSRSPKASAPRRHAAPVQRPLDVVVALQLADGSWALEDELARALGWADAKSLRSALGREPSGEGESRAAGTALALVWLERECGDTREEWRLLAEKGRAWLDKWRGTGWLEIAREALSRR
jgi:Ca-activated chloride channel family protein